MTNNNRIKKINYIWSHFIKKDSNSEKIQRAIRKTPIFQSLSKKELRQLEQIVHIRHYRPQENIFQQGEIGIGMYIILNGSIDITVNNYNLEEHDQNLFITQMGKDDFFGELSLVEPESLRTATATANQETTLIGFFKPDLLELAERRPYMGIKIMLKLGETLGLRLKEATNKVSELKNRSLRNDLN